MLNVETVEVRKATKHHKSCEDRWGATREGHKSNSVPSQTLYGFQYPSALDVGRCGSYTTHCILYTTPHEMGCVGWGYVGNAPCKHKHKPPHVTSWANKHTIQHRPDSFVWIYSNSTYFALRQTVFIGLFIQISIDLHDHCICRCINTFAARAISQHYNTYKLQVSVCFLWVLLIIRVGLHNLMLYE